MYTCKVSNNFNNNKNDFDKFLVRLHGSDLQLTDRKLCNNKFTWCFHKA